jgi:hypothetical protein
MQARQLLVRSLVTVAVATGAAFVPAGPAAAVTNYGCVYPRVCFYLTTDDFIARRPTAAYQDVTSYDQPLGPRSYGSRWMYNSRNDDGALIRYTNGEWTCVQPNVDFLITGRTVRTVRIMDSPLCNY